MCHSCCRKGHPFTRGNGIRTIAAAAHHLCGRCMSAAVLLSVRCLSLLFWPAARDPRTTVDSQKQKDNRRAPDKSSSRADLLLVHMPHFPPPVFSSKSIWPFHRLPALLANEKRKKKKNEQITLWRRETIGHVLRVAMDSGNTRWRHFFGVTVGATVYLSSIKSTNGSSENDKINETTEAFSLQLFLLFFFSFHREGGKEK